MEDQTSARLNDLERRLAKVEGGYTFGRSSANQVTPGTKALLELTTLDPSITGQWLQAQVNETGSGVVAYAGAGPWDVGTVAWQIERTWDDILTMTGRATASLLSALASPIRLKIVGAILRGSHTTSELTGILDQPSSGQLFHHLKDLIAAGVIHQPLRGVYAIKPPHVVALLTIMCAAIDLIPADVDPD